MAKGHLSPALPRPSRALQLKLSPYPASAVAAPEAGAVLWAPGPGGPECLLGP